MSEPATDPGGNGRLPDFLIIGAKKAGTTALARYLGAHPDVFMPRRKELHFFDRHHEAGLDWYERWFQDALPAQVVGEATPDYLCDPEARSRMGRDLPGARLIAVLRDPVDRAYSRYWMLRSRGGLSLTFEEAIEADPDYMEHGRYLPQLQAVCDVYPRGSLLVQIFEKAIADPVGRYREACRFLDIDDRFIPRNLGDKIGGYTTYRSDRIRGLSKRLLRGGGPVARPVARTVARLNSGRNASYPPMEMITNRELHERFAEDNAALAAWLREDLSLWSGRRSRHHGRTAKLENP